MRRTEIYVRRFYGTLWEEMGTGSATLDGISKNSGASTVLSIALESATATSEYPIIAWKNNTWSNNAQDKGELYVRRFNGAAWVEWDGSVSGRGISHTDDISWVPVITMEGDIPYITWQEETFGGMREVYVKRWTP